MLVSVLNDQEYSPNSYGEKTVKDSLKVIHRVFDWRVRPYVAKLEL